MEVAAKDTNCTRRSTPGSRFDTSRMRARHEKYSFQANYFVVSACVLIWRGKGGVRGKYGAMKFETVAALVLRTVLII